jgi:hypothetical protein
MMVYAKSLLVGLCAAAVVIGLCWRVGLCPTVVYPPPPSSHSSAVAPLGDGGISVGITYGSMTKTTVPWYVATMAGLAVVMAGAWQLRRPWRNRR